MHRRVLALSLAATVVALTGCSPTLFRASEHFGLDVPWDDYERVVVRTRNGHVELLPGASDEIRISGVKEAGGLTLGEAQANLDRLTIVAEPDDTDPTTFVIAVEIPTQLRHKSVSASLDVRVPASCAADVNTGNGYIRAQGLDNHVTLRSSNGRIIVEDVSGRVEAVTSNGRVQATNIAGDLEVDTSNGRIIAEAVTGDCRLTTSNGRVDVRRAEGNVWVGTSNGSISVEATPPPEGKVVLETSNGSIHADLPPGMRGMLSLRSTNGSIDTDFHESTTLTRPRWSNRSFEAELNGGGAGRITASTSNGSIRLICR
jgi:hypothetical protein